MIKDFKEKYKTNPKFKTQVQRGAIFFGLFVAGISIYYAMKSKGESEVVSQDELAQTEEAIQVKGNYIPTDTSRFVEDKSYFYKEDEQRQAMREDNENSLASSLDDAKGNDNSGESDELINRYIKARSASVKRMQTSTSSYERRNYNYQGNNEDYVTKNTDEYYSDRASGSSSGSSASYGGSQDNYYSSSQSSDRRSNGTQKPKVISKDDVGMEVPVRLLTQREYIVSGERLTFAFLTDCKINGIDVPKGQTITGTAQDNGDRLNIMFQTIKLKGHIVRVNITLYGNDGIEGILISGQTDETFADKKGSQLGRSLSSNVPFVGGIVGEGVDFAADALKKNNRKIKLVKNFTCFVIIKEKPI